MATLIFLLFIYFGNVCRLQFHIIWKTLSRHFSKMRLLLTKKRKQIDLFLEKYNVVSLITCLSFPVQMYEHIEKNSIYVFLN